MDYTRSNLTSHATFTVASEVLKSNIYPTDESETDCLVTKALVLGDFESAVSLCLSSNRFADAILLAVKGGSELLQRTQKAFRASDDGAAMPARVPVDRD